MQLFYCPDILKGNTSLDAEESRHCSKVLRKQKGDLIQITNGSGQIFDCTLDDISHNKCSFRIESESKIKSPEFSIHIAIAPTKNTDRIEWFVEKAVEIGIQQISFIQSTFSERKHLNLDRLNKKAISAMKQSGRAYLPQLNELTKLNLFIGTHGADQLFVAHLEGSHTKHLMDFAKPNNSYLVIIGPEGGFAESELGLLKEKGFGVAKLNDYRLRTETAGIAACCILNNINQIK